MFVLFYLSVFCSKNDLQNILSNRHLSVCLLEYNMSVLTYFVFFLVSLGYVLSECIYVRVAKVLDCSDQGLTKIPYVPTAANRRKYIIHVLNLRRNNVKSVSERELTNWYPELKMVDLRQNPNLNCSQVRSFTRIVFKVDCVRPKILKVMSRSSKCDASTGSINIYFSKTLPTYTCQTCYSSSFYSSMENSTPNKSRTLLLIFIPLSLGFLVGITVFSAYLIVRRRQVSQRNERCNENNEMTEAASVQTSMTPDSDSSIELYNITQV